MKRIAILLAPLALSGCFVFDEIQKGREIMDSHSPKVTAQQQQPEPDAAAAGGDAPGLVAEMSARVGAWWKNALEEEPIPRDPNDGIVACEVEGSVSFTRESDCRLRGGRVGKKRS